MSLDQCHKLIIEAYAQFGGLHLAKAEVQVNPLVVATTYHGAFVADAGLCLHHKRTSAVNPGRV